MKKRSNLLKISSVIFTGAFLSSCVAGPEDKGSLGRGGINRSNDSRNGMETVAGGWVSPTYEPRGTRAKSQQKWRF
ncbi:MAG: hypothetical protein GY915_06715 [bacterium]|nr:hypothetical protein [bacterium]